MNIAKRWPHAPCGAAGPCCGVQDVCRFCRRCCRVALSRSMPAAVVRAFSLARCNSLATCDAGAAYEHALYGASYTDVIEARMATVPGMSARPSEGGGGGGRPVAPVTPLVQPASAPAGRAGRWRRPPRGERAGTGVVRQVLQVGGRPGR